MGNAASAAASDADAGPAAAGVANGSASDVHIAAVEEQPPAPLRQRLVLFLGAQPTTDGADGADAIDVVNVSHEFRVADAAVRRALRGVTGRARDARAAAWSGDAIYEEPAGTSVAALVQAITGACPRVLHIACHFTPGRGLHVVRHVGPGAAARSVTVRRGCDRAVVQSARRLPVSGRLARGL